MRRCHTQIALAAVVAVSLGLASCATQPDPLRPARERLAAASADPDMRTYAAQPLGAAHQSLVNAAQAGSDEAREHYVYMMNKNLDLARTIVERRHAERQLATLNERAGVEAKTAAPAAETVEQMPLDNRSSSAIVETGAPGKGDTVQRSSRQSGQPPSQSSTQPLGQPSSQPLGQPSSQPSSQPLGQPSNQPLSQPSNQQPPKDRFARLEALKPGQSTEVSIRNLDFDSGESRLGPATKRDLEPLVAQLRGDSSLNVLVEGHTDNVGSKSENLRISLSRATAVKTFLVEQGIASNRIQTIGLGESGAIASNATEAGRAQNRRIEFVIYRNAAAKRPG